MKRFALGLLFALVPALFACPTFDYAAGRFWCQTDDDCPAGQSCDVELEACEPTDDGSGGSAGDPCALACSRLGRDCESVMSSTQCQGLCFGGSDVCKNCISGSSCETTAGCATACDDGGTGGSGGPTTCERNCGRLKDCPGFDEAACITDCSPGGITCRTCMGNATCANIEGCLSSCRSGF